MRLAVNSTYLHQYCSQRAPRGAICSCQPRPRAAQADVHTVTITGSFFSFSSAYDACQLALEEESFKFELTPIMISFYSALSAAPARVPEDPQLPRNGGHDLW